MLNKTNQNDTRHISIIFQKRDFNVGETVSMITCEQQYYIEFIFTDNI